MMRVRVTNAHPHLHVPRDEMHAATRRVLRGEGVQDAEISIVFIACGRCRRLNRQYLGHDYETDVISFPLGSPGHLEGEVYVNLDRARTQARRYLVSLRCEVARLVIHGVLHLTGERDHTQADVRRMRRKEDRYLGRVR